MSQKYRFFNLKTLPFRINSKFKGVFTKWLHKFPIAILKQAKLFHADVLSIQSTNIILQEVTRRYYQTDNVFAISPIDKNLKTLEEISEDVSSVKLKCPKCKSNFTVERRRFLSGKVKWNVCEDCRKTHTRRSDFTENDYRFLISQQRRVFNQLMNEQIDLTLIYRE